MTAASCCTSDLLAGDNEKKKCPLQLQTLIKPVILLSGISQADAALVWTTRVITSLFKVFLYLKVLVGHGVTKVMLHTLIPRAEE